MSGDPSLYATQFGADQLSQQLAEGGLISGSGTWAQVTSSGFTPATRLEAMHRATNLIAMDPSAPADPVERAKKIVEIAKVFEDYFIEKR